MFLLPLVVLLMELAPLMTLGGPAVVNLQPPPIYRYPSFSNSFGQRIVDVVGRSMKSEALKILNAFDVSTKQA